MHTLMNKSFLLLLLLCPILIQSDEQDVQQTHRKVERINLRDFGITKANYSQRQSEPTFKQPFDGRSHGHRPPTDHAFDINFRGHGERRTEWTDRRRPPEKPLSSPLDWTTSVRRVGDNVFARVDFAANETRLVGPYERPFEPIKHRRNCSAECVANRYLKHYTARGCRPLSDDECKCPLSFHCPQEVSSRDSSVCRYDGRTYRVGTRIPVPNPCRVCECRDFGTQRETVLARIDCGVFIECPEQAFGVKPDLNCYFAYDRDQCCGHQVCHNSSQPRRTQKVCNYRGKEYMRGQKIYPEEDNCLSCLCDDNWKDERPLESGSCRRNRCEFDLDKDFQNGCLPIYHEGTCCPIEYLCPKNTTIRNGIRHPNYCYFDGREYSIGSKLSSGNVCVECLCRAPPDFTCVHKSCPTPPHNCFVGKWDNTVCCQRYICSTADRIRDESQFRQNYYST